MGLIINERKTKNMLLSYRNHSLTGLVVEQMKFETVKIFKYNVVRTDITCGKHK